MIILSPVAAYYKEGLNPVRLITEAEYVRAAKGGLGGAKTPANYAASLLPGNEAHKKGSLRYCGSMPPNINTSKKWVR